MGKPTIVVSLGFKPRGEMKPLRGLLRYLQYRDGSLRREAFLETGRYPEGVSDSAQPANREARWVDRGMGEGYREIANRAYDWQARRTLARTWVISPDPELMAHVPDAQRFDLVRRVTEQTVERWYSDNGWGTAEYSYVLHDKRRAQDGLQMVHAHVITPATVRVDEAGELGRIDHVVKKAHIRDLHHTAAEAFEQELGRVLGRDRAREVIAERDARLERERHPDRARQERFRQLHALADVQRLLDMEKDARQAKRTKRRDRRRSLRRQAELRMYARYVNEDRRRRREADYIRMKAARQQEQEHELAQERQRHRQRVERIEARGRRIPTHAEIREQEDEERRRLSQYYLNLFMERGLLERDSEGREREGQSLELEL